MKKLLPTKILHVFIILLPILYFSNNITAESNLYLLGPGDHIEIRVFGQDDLSINAILGNSGKINYPFLDELKIAGLTVKQVESLIEKGLKNGYLKKPNVYVFISQYRSFYIHGEVNRAGGYPYQPGLTVNQAVALAGGLTERASKDKIYLIKEGDKDNRRKVSMVHRVNAGNHRKPAVQQLTLAHF